MKSILIPTDFSESANHAARIGVQLAKKLKAGVSFLHLLSTPVEWAKLSLEKEKLYPETKTKIGDAKDALLKLERRAEKDGVEANSMLLFNQGIEDITTYIKKDRHFLVVMGTHGEKGVGRLMGSNTQRVLRNSPVPVLAVKIHDKLVRLKKIGLASDFEEKSRESFNSLLNLAKDLELEAEIVFVNVPYNFMETIRIEKTMEKFLNPYPEMKIKTFIYNAYNEERGIGMYIKSQRPDIIATITHKHSELVKFFRPGITEGLINNFDLPVLSLHLHSEPVQKKGKIPHSFT